MITGSAGGIGKAIAHRLAEAGAGLDLIDIDERKLQSAERELSNISADIDIHRIDLSDKKEIDELWKKLRDHEPDILVNNAGVYPFKNFMKVDEGFYRRAMDVNLNSVFWMCQNMISRRLKRGGVIINVGSIEAIVPFKEDLTHYSMSKAGIIALTRSLANEYGRHGFRIIAILPGGTVTPGTKSAAKEILHFKLDLVKAGIEFKQRLPINRLGRPDEVAWMVSVLACDLSTYVQGALILVDGGFLSA